MLRGRDSAPLAPMCRLLGCVAREPVAIRHDLLEAPNPLIRQSEEHDSGWGMAAHLDADGTRPELLRAPEAAHASREFEHATALRARIFSVHVRRATMGGLAPENTHPFARGAVSFCHNGTVPHAPALAGPPLPQPGGQTDSERLFLHLLAGWDPGDVAGSLRRTVLATLDTGPLSAVNCLLSDGRRLYAYRLGVFELHWLARPGQLLVGSEPTSAEPWLPVAQDVLLTLDPDDPTAPRAERLVGDEPLAGVRFVRFGDGAGLRGRERGAFAARRAARPTAAAAGA